MKKRLLALCLAAAMLLGMLPALTLSTNAVETNVTSVTIDDFITTAETKTAAGVAAGYGAPTYAATSGAASVINNASYFSFRKNCNDWWTVTSNDHSKLSFDHTKEILLEQFIAVNTGDDQSVQGSMFVQDAGNVYGSGCFAVTLMDANAGKFIYYYITGGAGESGTEYQIGFLMPDGETNEYVSLGIDGTANTGGKKLGMQWNLDGSVTVHYDGAEKGTVEGVTWTVDSTKDAGSAYNPAAQVSSTESTTAYDFIAFRSYGFNQLYVYDLNISSLPWPTVITHTEYLPVEMDSYFTDETLAADGALTESSWSAANFEEVADGLQAAVLVNKGVAYVALQGTNGTYNVQLGTITKSVEVKDGVGEVEIGNVGLTNYGETRDLTVGTAKATVTFAAKKVNTAGTGATTVATNVTVGHSCPTAFGFSAVIWNGSATYINVRHTNKATGTWYKTGAYADVAIDHTQNVKFNLINAVQAGFFTKYPNSLYVDDSGNLAVNTNGTYYNAMVFTLKDHETGNFIYAYLTADAEQDIQLGFLLNDKTTNKTVDVGISCAGSGVSDYSTVTLDSSTNPYSGLHLIWNVDGSVTVMNGTTELETVDNATWTADSTATAGSAANPIADGSAYDFVKMVSYSVAGWYREGNANGNGVAGCNGGAQAYLYGLTFTTTPVTLDITTSVADELKAKVEAALGDLNDVAALPQAVEHDALGTVALTWSDSRGLVNNNVLTIPGEDTKTVLTAMSGTTEIWSGEVTVKAADPIVGVFTPEDLTSSTESWTLVPFTNLNNSTDSVAVLATDVNTVYVAVKSADSSATVILNGSEQTVAIADGMGVVKYENVALSAYGDARTIKVTTSTGSLTTKVLFNATEIKLPYTKVVTADLHFNAAAVNGCSKSSGGLIAFKANDTRLNIFAKSNTNGDLNIDRTKDVTINLGIVVQKGGLGSNDVTYTVSNGTPTASSKPSFQFSFVDRNGTNGSITGWLTADAAGMIKLGLVSSDGTNNVVELTNEYAQWASNPADIRADLRDLDLVWHTNGDITVMFNGNVLKTVTGATWMNATTGTANTPFVQSTVNTVDTNEDFVNVFAYTNGTTGQIYIYNISFSTPEEGSVQAFEPAAIKASNATLSSDVGLNFWLNDVGGAALTLEHMGNTETFETSKMTAGNNGLLKASLNLAAAQMADDVKYTLVDAYGMTTTGTTSVEDYAAEALKDATDDNVKNMINAMLNYGYHAKAYFEYDTENAMNAVAAPELGILTEVVDTKYDRVVNNGLAGIKATGATLRLEDQVKIRVYFTGDITAYEVTGGEAVYDEANDRYYVEIAVAPKNLDEMYTVEVTDGTNTTSVSYGCMTYLLAKANDAELGDLMQAMYIYSQAAEAYPA